MSPIHWLLRLVWLDLNSAAFACVPMAKHAQNKYMCNRGVLNDLFNIVQSSLASMSFAEEDYVKPASWKASTNKLSI
jgi:hypothetical protein